MKSTTNRILSEIHDTVKKHTHYARVYSNKRKTGRETVYNGISDNCIRGHRIKYYLCDPNAKQLRELNAELGNRFGLKAYRIAGKGNWTAASLEIRFI